MNQDKRLDPSNWINRPMNGFGKIKNELCVVAVRSDGPDNAFAKYVSDSKEGMSLILCRYVRQGAEELALPIGMDEGRSFNVPMKIMIDVALENMNRIFPAIITDVSTGIVCDAEKIPERKRSDTPSGRMYSFTPAETSVSAEEQVQYDSGSSSRLRYIVNTSAAVGEALLFYPGLLHKLGSMTRHDPIILSGAPGKLYIFDSTGRKNNLNGYLKRYMERFNTDSFEPHIYKYYRANRIVYDLTPVSSEGKNMLKKAHIPKGSVVSAWGDVSYRCRLLDINRGK